MGEMGRACVAYLATVVAIWACATGIVTCAWPS